jgi:hypothetical protein
MFGRQNILKQPGENYLLSFPNGAYIYFEDKKLVAVQYKTQSTVSIVPPRFKWVSNDLKYITRPHVFE